MKTCPICARGKLERGTQLQTFRYKGKQLRYEQPGAWCSACGEGILEHVDMTATEQLLSDFRARLDGYLTSEDIRRIRKKLGLTRKRAEEMLGADQHAFSRYEAGGVRPPRVLDTLLRLLDHHPELLQEIPKGKAA